MGGRALPEATLKATERYLVEDVSCELNGRQMADVARANRPKLKVLFITGYAENAVLSGGQLGAGMSVLTKPFSVEVLASRVRELLAAS